MRPRRIAGLTVLLALLPLTGVLAQDPADGPTYIARDVEPTIKNMEELALVMRSVYPAGYRDTGLDVTAIMWVYVNPDGTTGGRKVLKSTGYAVFDQAAEKLVDAMVYTPALRDGEPIGVWINQAVKFDSGDSGRFMEGPALLAEEHVDMDRGHGKDEDEDKP
jgi:TonB family protein